MHGPDHLLVLALAESGGGAIAGPALMPAWLVLPLAALLMLVVASHALALHRIEMPASRRRLRVASGAVILLLVPIMAYALCYVPPEDHRAFVLSWLVITALVGLIIVLAAVDILQGIGTARRDAAALRRTLETERARAAADARAQPPGSERAS